MCINEICEMCELAGAEHFCELCPKGGTTEEMTERQILQVNDFIEEFSNLREELENICAHYSKEDYERWICPICGAPLNGLKTRWVKCLSCGFNYISLGLKELVGHTEPGDCSVRLRSGICASTWRTHSGKKCPGKEVCKNVDG